MAETFNVKIFQLEHNLLNFYFGRTYNSFETQLKKGILLNPTDYVIPTEICAMVNVVLGNDDILLEDENTSEKPDYFHSNLTC